MANSIKALLRVCVRIFVVLGVCASLRTLQQQVCSAPHTHARARVQDSTQDMLHVRQTRNAFSHSRKLPNKRRANLRMCVASAGVCECVRVWMGCGWLAASCVQSLPLVFRANLIWLRCLCRGSLASIAGPSERDFGGYSARVQAGRWAGGQVHS